MGYIGQTALPFNPLATSGKPRDAQRFNGNGSTTTFTLTHPVNNPTDLEVFVENVQQEPLTAYDAVGNQLIFTEAPPSGTNNVYVVYRNIEPGVYASIPDGAITFNKLANNIRLFTTDNFTGDNTTISFGLSSVVPDANTLMVTVDGVFQRAPIHYTATGNTITFASAPPSSSNVHVRHLGFRTTQTITALPANTTISQPILQNLTATGTSTFTGNVSVSGEITGNVNFDSNTLFVDSVGNKVGIGTSSPSYKLDVQGASPRFWLKDTTASGSHFEVSADTSSVGIFNRSNLPMVFGTNNTERMRINADGGLQTQVTGGGSLMETFGCRAWVNFNGTGTVAIRASGNVSSITDVAEGQYYINFVNAMPDTNYAYACSSGRGAVPVVSGFSADMTTTRFLINCQSLTEVYTDTDTIFATVFR